MKMKIKKRNARKEFILAECISKITVTDNMTQEIARKLDSYVALKGVKIVNNIGKGAWY